MSLFFKVLEKPGAFLATLPAPRPGRGLAADLGALKKQGVHTVVSLLEAEEAEALELDGEAAGCAKVGLAFRNLPVPDHRVPGSAEELESLCRELHAGLERGESAAIHCLAGIGRSSLVAACVMMLDGLEPDEALLRIGAVRGLPVPETREQWDWIHAQRLRLKPTD